MKIIVIDNYDSFVHNLVSYLEELGAETTVVRNDETTRELELLKNGEYQGVLVSPGPGTPEEAGASKIIIALCANMRIPIFGVCLGHQAIAEVFGATVSHAPELMHGKTSLVTHTQQGPFKNIPSPVKVTRYHSLSVRPETVGKGLLVTAQTQTGVIMGIIHETLPIWGVQFHPESVITEHGYMMIGNWISLCGDEDAPIRAMNKVPLLGSC